MKQHLAPHCAFPASDWEFLMDLGRWLLPYFPLSQTLEVLEDYEEYLLLKRQEYFNCGDCASEASTASPIRQVPSSAFAPTTEHPEQIAWTLRREQPQSASFFYRHMVPWGIAFLAAVSLFYATFYTPQAALGGFCFLAIAPISVFGLLSGRGRLAIEARFSPASPRAKQHVALHLFFFAAVMLSEAFMQYSLRHVERLLAFLRPASVGAAVDTFLIFLLLLTAALLAWALQRSAIRSIGYFPVAIHALSAFLFFAGIRNVLHSMEVAAVSPSLQLALPLRFYAVGLLLTLLWGIFLRRSSHNSGRPWNSSLSGQSVPSDIPEGQAI